jgi:DNA polymerase III delta subunit
MKSRELVKRIKAVALPEGGMSLLGMAETLLDGAETNAESVVEAAQSPSLGGGLQLVIVRDAHSLKAPEEIAPLFGEKGPRENLSYVCVFLSKDFDQRKKVSKLLAEKAAVVACDEVPEAEREAWIGYLGKRRGLELSREMALQLTSLDPWSLDIVDQELEKFSLSSDPEVLGAGGPMGGPDVFFDAFFARDLKTALTRAGLFADRPDESLPLLGLFAWNVRQFALHLAEKESGRGGARINPYLAEKLGRWSRAWNLADILELQRELERVDFSIKQTPLLPLGIWTGLVTRFCR